MINTPENREKFIAHHWGIETDFISHDLDGAIVKVGRYFFHELSKYHRDKAKVVLNDMSLITKEHLEELGKLYRSYTPTATDGKLREWGHDDDKIKQININNGNRILNLHFRKANVLDFLRLRGYAVPWNDLEVEDLLEYGWIKIRK